MRSPSNSFSLPEYPPDGIGTADYNGNTGEQRYFLNLEWAKQQSTGDEE